MCAIPHEVLAPRELRLDVIRLDGDTQSRVSLNPRVVSEYAQLMAEGVKFPPVRIWFDGQHHWLSDGFHRVAAAKSVGLPGLTAMVQSGTLDDARWDGLAANTAHGLRRSQLDIQSIVTRALRHKRATGISVNQLAKHLGIPEPTLRRWIKKLDSSNDEGSQPAICNRASAAPRQPLETCRAPGRPLLREKHPLFTDLASIRGAATCKRTQALANILEKWFLGAASSMRVREAMENLFRG